MNIGVVNGGATPKFGSGSCEPIMEESVVAAEMRGSTVKEQPDQQEGASASPEQDKGDSQSKRARNQNKRARKRQARQGDGDTAVGVARGVY